MSMKYMIIDAKNADELENSVSNFMEENYMTRIGSLVITNFDGEKHFYQAVFFNQEDWVKE